MTKKGFLFLIFCFIFLLGIIFIFIFRDTFSKKRTKLNLNTYPRSKVFIDGKEAGTTPYENDTLFAGEINLKLVPETEGVSPLERTLILNPETETVINWDFDKDFEKTAGEIFWLEKTTLKDKAGLVVNCQPDSCSVSVDGQMRGFAPLALEDIGEGKHKITISLPGYKQREIAARTMTRYRLMVEVKLAKEEEIENISEEEKLPEEGNNKVTPTSDLRPTKKITPTPTSKKLEEKELEKPYVLIKDTPTGWLRVRIEPSTVANEIAKVNPGEKYRLLDEKNGWYKIEYEEGKEGWISGTYAEKFQ